MPVNVFPNVPFLFDPDDKDLITYIQEQGPCYLDDSRSLVEGLNPEDHLGEQRDVLEDLWTRLLTDALRWLKRKDPREYSDNPKVDSDSFFNRQSLGTERLDKVLGAFTNFESLMYGARPDRYRDHVTHTFRVWIIGHGFLKGCLAGRLRVPENDVEISNEEWECIWAITALCHDIGYPLTELDNINQRAKDALRPQGLEPAGDLSYVFSPRVRPLQDTILRMMSSKAVRIATNDSEAYATHLQNKYYMKFVNSFGEPEHGVVSALVVGKSLVYFLESDFSQDALAPLSSEDARQFVIRREILRSIAAHTCPEIYHLRFDTLAFLLFIVDELQCWGRPTFEQLMRERQSGRPDGVEDKVRLVHFDGKRVEIEVETAGNWSEEEDVATKRRLENIRKRLRLAVGSPGLGDLTFSYAVRSANAGQEHSLKLLDGRISTSWES